uniref:MAGE family member B6 n=1 Tax=Pipistrellus kuhlii TaxID=59472 RepID=A0A7J7V665_PIPKU|nr:MAGE family member B6 [Pipistrellus kuhlii]
MPRGHKSKLRAREKRRQNKAEDPAVKSVQAPAGEEGEAACSSSSVFGDGPSTSTVAGILQALQSATATTSATAGASGEGPAVKAKGQVQKSKKVSQVSTSTGDGTLLAPQDAPVTTSATAGGSGEISDSKVSTSRKVKNAKGQVQKSKKASQVSTSTGDGIPQALQSAPATTSAAAGASGEGPAVKAKGQVQKSKKASQASTSTESSGLDLISKKATLLVEYLLCQYKMNEPIKKGDMLKIIHKWYRKDFPEILKKVSEHMDLVHGLELKEVKPNGNYYTLVDSQGNTSDESLGRGFRFPTRGILMPLLAVIFLNSNRASEEEIWEFLSMMSVYDGKTHFIFGEPRKLITQDLVQEKYLVYQPVPNSDPPRYEFLWGPRAHAETSKMKVLEFLAKLNDTRPSAFAIQYVEALRDEEERAQAILKAATPSKASRSSKNTSKHYPQPE